MQVIRTSSLTLLGMIETLVRYFLFYFSFEMGVVECVFVICCLEKGEKKMTLLWRILPHDVSFFHSLFLPKLSVGFFFSFFKSKEFPSP